MLRCLLLLIVIHSVLSAQTQIDSTQIAMHRFWASGRGKNGSSEKTRLAPMIKHAFRT